jgi:hypothetical protein
MPTTVQMLQTRHGDAGATLTAGQQYSLRTELADVLVAAGAATYAWNADPDSFTSEVFWSDSTGAALVRPDGTLKADIARKVVETATAARGNNASELGPWRAPSNWVAATTYRIGNQVQGIGAGVGNLYQMHSGTSATGANGISAGATGPTTRAPAIVDNTCVWQYIGPVLTPTTLSGAPTLTFSATDNATLNAAGQSKIYGPWVAFSTLADVQKFAVVSGGVLGSDPAFAPDMATLGFPLGSVGSNRAANPYCCAEFETDAPRCDIFLDRGFSVSTNWWNVEVNGRLVYHGNNTFPTANVGDFVTPACLTIDMTAMPVGSVKRVKVYFRIWNGGFTSIRVPPAYSVWKPNNPNAWKLGIEGDSLILGGNTQPGMAGNELPASLARRLGASQYYSNAVGGTAYNNNGGSFTTYLERLPQLVSFAPDVVLVGSCHNGATTPTVVSWIQATRAALPNALILVGGSALLQGETPGSGVIYNAEVAAMAAASSFTNDPLVKFIPVLTGDNPWFYGAASANAASPTGGSGDRFTYVSGALNDSHPMWVGYEYYAMRYAAAIEAACRSLL